jgi:hypothetical protein
MILERKQIRRPIRRPQKSIILRGILDKALAGNYICLRGYATMKDLHSISKADGNYQRNLIKEHHEKMVDFLNDDEHLFFPEVILGCSLGGENNSDAINSFIESLNSRDGSTHHFSYFDLRYAVTRSNTISGDIRAESYFRKARLSVDANKINDKDFFHRIDGNHRLSVLDEPERLKDKQRQKFEGLNVPFCLVLFPTSEALTEHSRVLFHNLNFHQIPITKEKNLSLILDDIVIFPEDKLEKAFGKIYIIARQILQKWDLDLIPYIKAVLEPNNTEKHCKRTFLINSLELLENKNNEPNAVFIEYDSILVKDALSKINPYFANGLMKEYPNHGLLTVYLYYAIRQPYAVNIFHNWVVHNHIYKTETIKAEELIKVFDCILDAKHRTIFVSMQFNPEPVGHYNAIKKAIEEVNQNHNLDLKIQPIRIDEYMKGHSYKITDEIISHIQGCGLLIADLTYGNKNVYHEVGFLMGLNAGKEEKLENCILVFNKRAENADFEKDVGFNINHFQILIANDTGDLTAKLRKQIEIFYRPLS